jgi:hypothetical protein
LEVGLMEEMSSEAALPPLYAAWAAALLDGPIPDETRATCGDCAMQPPDGAPETGRGYFNGAVKCCTYTPILANFLAGRILRETDADGEFGRETLRARLRNGDGVSPLGLDTPRSYRLLYTGGLGFGQSEALLCPHYIHEGGLCGIWRHRNSICSTWYCKHNRGAVGGSFWQELQRLLTSLEQDLSWWCVLELDVGTDVLNHLLARAGRGASHIPLSPEEISGKGSPALQRALWGSWRGREEAFYVECARRVEALSWSGVLQAVSPETRARALAVREAYRKLVSLEVPARLRPGTFTVVESTPSRATVSTYRQFDPLSLPRTLLNVLPDFDGRPTDEVLSAIAARHKIRIAPDLVRKLVDYQVLAPAPDAAET